MQHPHLQRCHSASRVWNGTLTFSTATDTPFIPQGPREHEMFLFTTDYHPSNRCLLKGPADGRLSYDTDVGFPSNGHRLRPDVLVVSSRRPTHGPQVVQEPEAG